jgi:uncharacterized protein YutE (UPF0331/DUF86 family)
MVEAAVIQRRLQALQGFVQGLRSRFGAVDRAAFVADEDARLIAERLLHLACEACIDIGNHVLASSGGRLPGGGSRQGA